MRFSVTLIFVVAALAACCPRESSTEAEPERAPPAQSASVGAPPPAETPPRYVGLWAVSQEMCEDPAWRFAPREVDTQGEVFCEFTQVTHRDARYNVKAMCTAEAPPAPYDIELAVGEDPRVMLVAGGPWMAGTRLVYCGPLSPR
jgi:hypothetical protein